MYEAIHVILQDSDELLPMGTTEPSVTPGIQIYNHDLVGGPITISFGAHGDPVEGLRVLERFQSCLLDATRELTKRAARAPLRPQLVHSAAGDPRGEGADMPASDR